MTLTLRKAQDRGRTRIDWLDSWHTFSFGHYRDPQWMGYQTLRVINDDIVAPAGGFAPHGHADMEIVTYVLSGALEHKDSLGNGSIIRPGDVQRMSAGTGIRHSEFNASKTEPVHLLQIWILPEKNGLPPGYEQKHFPAEGRTGRFQLVASPGGAEGSVTVHQNARMYAALLNGAKACTLDLTPEAAAWVHVARGQTLLNGAALSAGDAAAVEDESSLNFTESRDAEVLVFALG